MSNKNNNSYNISKIDDLFLIMKYNKKIMENYDDEYLNNLEDTIYGTMTDEQKIKYEFNKYTNYKNDIKNYNVKCLYLDLEELATKLLAQDPLDYKLLKKVISTIQILLDNDYAFYNSVKDFDDNYIALLESTLEKKKNRRK